MKKAFTSGMILFLAMTTTVSCTQENVMLETTPQVKNQEVRFCFFESSIVPIGQDEESNLARTRADGSEKSLKDAKLYTDLQVCLIPKGDETTAGYTVRQENWDDKFGNVSLQVPAGEYTLIAVAAKTDLQQEKRIEVKSRYEMTFANNIVRDMAYTLQDEVVEEFQDFTDWMDKYQMLIDLGNELAPLDEKYKNEQNLIDGCQSRVWLQCDYVDGKLVFTADSDALIVKGIIALLIRVLSGHTPTEIMDADLYFVEKIGLKDHLSPTRSNGLLAMIKQIRMYALAYKTKEAEA
jgi:sulfur transfer protein SufE